MPVVGISEILEESASITDTIRGITVTCPTDAIATAITAAIRSGDIEINIRYRFAIYDKEDFSLVAQTEATEIYSESTEFNWRTLNFLEPYPELEKGKEYVIVAWADVGMNDTIYIAYDENTEEDTALTEIEKDYSELEAEFPDPLTLSPQWEYRQYSIYLTFQSMHGVLTKLGMAVVAGLITADVGGTPFDYIAIGIGDTEATADDVELEEEIKRKATVGTVETTDFPNDTAQWVATFSAGDGLTGEDDIAEAAVFNAAEDGVMLFRQVMIEKQTVDWDSGESLRVTATCQVAQAE